MSFCRCRVHLRYCMAVQARDTPKSSLHKGNVDACVLGLAAFENQVAAQRFQFLLCLHAPKRCVLKTSPAIAAIDSTVHPARLHEAVATETERDWERIAKWCVVWQCEWLPDVCCCDCRDVIFCSPFTATRKATSKRAEKSLHTRCAWRPWPCRWRVMAASGT